MLIMILPNLIYTCSNTESILLEVSPALPSCELTVLHQLARTSMGAEIKIKPAQSLANMATNTGHTFLCLTSSIRLLLCKVAFPSFRLMAWLELPESIRRQRLLVVRVVTWLQAQIKRRSALLLPMAILPPARALVTTTTRWGL